LSPPQAGSLYLVSTPIGNLADMTFRAVEVLSSVALVVAEDTRHSRHLLDHYKISTPLRSYHEHNEAREAPALVQRLLAGDSIALISDAGTPLVSDPGARLVDAAIAAGIRVVPVPGASSILAALVGSGITLQRFLFVGFLPRKGKERWEEIQRVVDSDSTTVLFESGNRVRATLADLVTAGASERHAVVARELTKQFEEFRRGSVNELAAAYESAAPRGEVVIVIEGKTAVAASGDEMERVAEELTRAGGSPREVMQRLVTEHRAPRNLAYKLAQMATEPRKRVTKRDEPES
jgi:16S rRNA (cytidine1402-2'-O)-methyltransferase